ncbi:MAG: glycogen-binding domain-containing protein [Treponemataceae bacterium]
MKKFASFCVLLFLFLTNLNSIDDFAYKKLVAGIVKAGPPEIRNGCLIFTQDQKFRHAGIAFEFEDYKTVHNFTRVPTNREGKSDDVLFFILEIPENISEIKYRVSLDGLWTKDPQNENCFFDYTLGVTVSTVKVPFAHTKKTKILENGFVQFYFEGEPNESVRLAGTFNNWDPFMYEMQEVRPGEYFLTLPLLSGKWQYAFFVGTTQFKDPTNSKTVFSKEGKQASVIVVP